MNEVEKTTVVTLCFSEWASNVAAASKKDCTLRLSTDFLPLNLITCEDLYPLIKIDDRFDILHGSKFSTGLDFGSGY